MRVQVSQEASHTLQNSKIDYWRSTALSCVVLLKVTVHFASLWHTYAYLDFMCLQ